MKAQCPSCGGRKFILMPPMGLRAPCPKCCAPAAAPEVQSAPVLRGLTSPVVVKSPAVEFTTLNPGPTGTMSAGPSHLRGIGPVMNVAIHAPDGTVLIAIMGQAACAEFGAMFNAGMRQIMSGQFDSPETPQ